MKNLLVLMFCSCLYVCVYSQPNWVNLLNDKKLRNWEQINGKAKYYLQDGILVGEAVLNSPNSFLATKEKYSNFILEMEFKVDVQLNSGIQIRSECIPGFKYGRVHGYQVEIGPL